MASECVRCGNCCDGEGWVVFGSGEYARLESLLGMTSKQIADTFGVREFVERGAHGWRVGPGRCPWFDAAERACGIYEARPQFCRDWPIRTPLGIVEARRRGCAMVGA